MSTSFPLIQFNPSVNSNSNGLISPFTAGNLLVAFWMAGTSTGGNPTLPTSLSDGNGNSYDLAGFTYPAAPTQATSGIYVCPNPVLTPTNPPVITFSGATVVPSGGPSIVVLEIGVPSVYSMYSVVCNEEDVLGGINFSTNQLNGVGVASNITLTSTGARQNGAQAVLILQNQFSDILVLYCDYDNTSSIDTWTTTGTIIATTIETQSGTAGRTAVVCSQAFTYSSSFCGFTGITVDCNNLPNGILNKAYSWPLGLSGGTFPYAWSITAGSLPTGLTINASTGVISGTPTVIGASWFTFQVVDANGATASATCAIGICGSIGNNLVFYARN